MRIGESCAEALFECLVTYRMLSFCDLGRLLEVSATSPVIRIDEILKVDEKTTEERSMKFVKFKRTRTLANCANCSTV